MKRPKFIYSSFVYYLIAFFILFSFLIIKNQRILSGDSENYNTLSNIFIDNGLFNIKGFALQSKGAIRGYLFPWLLAVIKLGNKSWNISAWFFMSLYGSFIFLYVIPSIIESIFQVKYSYFYRLIAYAIFILLYAGLFLYPLSDFWGMSFFLCAVWSLIDIIGNEKMNICILSLLKVVFSGIMLGAAYNTRTIYQFGAYAIVVLYFYVILKQKSINFFWIQLALLFVGIFIVLLPEGLRNLYGYGHFSLKVLTQNNGDLYLKQLYWGIYVQKYETNVSGGNAQVIFLDGVGRNILAAENITVLNSIKQYINLVLKYHLEFLGIYTRHFINMLDIRYPDAYIQSFKTSIIYPLINQSIIYIAAIRFVRWLKGNILTLRTLYLIILLVPTLAIIPGAIEVRFGVMINVLSLGLTFSNINFNEVKKLKVNDKLLLILGYMIFMAIFFAFCGSTMATAENVIIFY